MKKDANRRLTGDRKNPKMDAGVKESLEVETGDPKNPKMTKQSSRKGAKGESLVDPTKTAADVADDGKVDAVAANDAAHETKGNDYQVIPGVDRNNQPRQ